ncbi:MAG: hypothetical protein IID45_08925, partial [Planctomycetes bacterium]|nr:hypothetical protein [Planctomycetota bacterium]
MPEILETQCPHCSATMKLKIRKALGKQAPCPQCKKPFLVKEMDATDEYGDFPTGEDLPAGDYVEDFGDDYGDDLGDDYEDDYEAEPRRSSAGKKSKSKQKRKKKQSARWVKPTLLAGGGVLGAGVVGLLIWLAISLFSNKIELAYLPPDAHMIS